MTALRITDLRRVCLERGGGVVNILLLIWVLVITVLVLRASSLCKSWSNYTRTTCPFCYMYVCCTSIKCVLQHTQRNMRIAIILWTIITIPFIYDDKRHASYFTCTGLRVIMYKMRHTLVLMSKGYWDNYIN